jgi:hypothetical protein
MRTAGTGVNACICRELVRDNLFRMAGSLVDEDSMTVRRAEAGIAAAIWPGGYRCDDSLQGRAPRTAIRSGHHGDQRRYETIGSSRRGERARAGLSLVGGDAVADAGACDRRSMSTAMKRTRSGLKSGYSLEKLTTDLGVAMNRGTGRAAGSETLG